MILDDHIFEEVYNKYFKAIAWFLNYYTHDRQAIETVIQDVFVKLWEEHRGKEINYIKTYLYASARNRMLNYLRDEKNRTVLLEKWAQVEMESRKAEDCVDRDEFFMLLQHAIDVLPERCKEIFILCKEEKLSYKEVARIQGVSVKTVENQMGIALKKIRSYILEHASDSATLFILLFNLWNK